MHSPDLPAPETKPVLKAQPVQRVLIETWGCQMNVADSETMLQQLRTLNYELTQDPEAADLVLLNTCHIREKAKQKVLSRLGVLRDIKAQRPGMRIAVAGCVAQAEGEKLIKAAPQIDILLGPGKIDQLPKLLHQNEHSGGKAVAIGFSREHAAPRPAETKATPAPSITGKKEVSRYVNIIQGCNNFCTFCVVPFTRGREVSRHPREILQEVQSLVADGASEVMLLGQNVNSYGLDLLEHSEFNAATGSPFVGLLKSVAAIQGLRRLRFTTSNPHDFTRDLADLFRTEPKLGRYLHLPVQSGNDTILERMRRKVTVTEYWERLHWLRAIDPEMAISTDLIVGFPGETATQFEDTLRLVEAARYSFVFAFKYSPRRGTAAARFQDQVSEAIKDARLAELNLLQDKITLELNRSEIGKQREVLFLYELRKEPGIFYGRTEQFRLVRVKANRSLVGQCLPVEIYDTNKTSLQGRLL